VLRWKGWCVDDRGHPGEEKDMPAKKLKDFLDKHKVKYVVIQHSTAYTSSEIAASAHVKGKLLAKTVIVRLDGRDVMAVLPSSYHVDLERLRLATRSGKAELAAEGEFAKEFPGCDEGGMPPFGNLYGMPVYVDPTLAADEQIAFNACTHTELIQMAYKDFAELVKPTVISFRQ
jgi:Ala-tRNA(Pro) deacylase